MLRGKTTTDVTVSIDYEECLKSIEQVSRWENEHANSFEDHSRIEVIYENLARDCRPEMRRIQDFLGLRIEDVRPSIYKQSNRSPSETISNYHELRERFEGSQWLVFFDD